MAEIFSVTVEEIIKQLNMEIIYAPENISSLVVTENDCWTSASLPFISMGTFRYAGNMGLYLAS